MYTVTTAITIATIISTKPIPISTAPTIGVVCGSVTMIVVIASALLDTAVGDGPIEYVYH